MNKISTNAPPLAHTHQRAPARRTAAYSSASSHGSTTRPIANPFSSIAEPGAEVLRGETVLVLAHEVLIDRQRQGQHEPDSQPEHDVDRRLQPGPARDASGEVAQAARQSAQQEDRGDARSRTAVPTSAASNRLRNTHPNWRAARATADPDTPRSRGRRRTAAPAAPRPESAGPAENHVPVRIGRAPGRCRPAARRRPRPRTRCASCCSPQGRMAEPKASGRRRNSSMCQTPQTARVRGLCRAGGAAVTCRDAHCVAPG